MQHAADHLKLGGDFDRRISLVSIDNAVELIIKTYLGLPSRARGSQGPSRKELEAAGESFPNLLDLLNRYASTRLSGLDLGDIEWYHRLRNQLYHSGNGITVDRSKVEAYFQIASTLFENLFGATLEFDVSQVTHTRTGEFLKLWTDFDQALRKLLPKKEGKLAYHWKHDFLEGISPEAARLWENLVVFRNTLVHKPEIPTMPELENQIQELHRLCKLLKIDRAKNTRRTGN